MSQKEVVNYNVIHKNEIEKMLLLLNKNLEIFKYLLLRSNQLDQKLKSTQESANTNRVSEVLSKEENLEEWVSNQEIRFKKSKPRSIVDVVEQWVENEVKRDIFRSLHAKYSHSISQELSTKTLRDLGTRLITLADKLENKS